MFNHCRILLHSVVECNNASVSIIICLVCSNVVTGCVILSLGECVLCICVDSICLCMYGMWIYILGGFKSVVLLWGVIGDFICSSTAHTFDVSNVWLFVCVMYFIVSSIMSPWSVSRSELDCHEKELIDARYSDL